VLVGLPQGVGVLSIVFHHFTTLVYFHDTHHVLVVLPQGVGGLAIFLNDFFVSISLYVVVYFSLFNITHLVLVGLPQVVDGLAILFYFILY
jgi:hypothetical protein